MQRADDRQRHHASRVTGEATERLKEMKDHLERLKMQGIEAID